MRPVLPLIAKPDKDITRKQNYISISPTKRDAEVFDKIWTDGLSSLEKCLFSLAHGQINRMKFENPGKTQVYMEMAIVDKVIFQLNKNEPVNDWDRTAIREKN